MIHAQDLRKAFGPLQALTGINFSIAQGELVALIGANGAGKTTLIRILSGLARASSGAATVAGFEVTSKPQLVRKHIGVVSHNTFLYGDLSAEENLRFYGRMYQVPDLALRIDELLAMMELNRRRHDLVRTFSRGMQQRLALARAILHKPTVLLLDEPFTGLDVHATDLLSGFIVQAIADHVTVLMTIHDLAYALTNTQRLLVLRKGKLMIDKAAGETDQKEVIEYITELN